MAKHEETKIGVKPTIGQYAIWLDRDEKTGNLTVRHGNDPTQNVDLGPPSWNSGSIRHLANLLLEAIGEPPVTQETCHHQWVVVRQAEQFTIVWCPSCYKQDQYDF